MLIRPHDDGAEDENRWRAFVVDQGFGHLAAAGVDRAVPVVVPTQFTLQNDHLVLHLARQNPIFACLEDNPQCVMSVAGDWAYIPGSWKAIGDEDPRFGIPTTYYAAVQLIGTATVMEDPGDVAAGLRAQLGDLEPDGDLVDPIEHDRSLRAIRGLRIAIGEVRAKFKFGGNVDQEHRDAIAAQLRSRGGPGDAAALRHIPGV